MAAINVTLKQCAVIEFCNAECETLICIHEHLMNIYGGRRKDVGTVQHCVHCCGEAVEGA